MDDARMQGLHILVVDDHASICMIVSRFLQNAGALVDVARDGHDALTMVLNGTYDLVVADVEMPQVGGLEMTKCIRRVARTRNLPIVIITAQDTDADRAAAMAAGANTFLPKPFSKEELLAAIRTVLPPSGPES